MRNMQRNRDLLRITMIKYIKNIKVIKSGAVMLVFERTIDEIGFNKCLLKAVNNQSNI